MIAAFGRHLLVRDAAGTELRARPVGPQARHRLRRSRALRGRPRARRGADRRSAAAPDACWRAPTCAARANPWSPTSRSWWWCSRRCPRRIFSSSIATCAPPPRPASPAPIAVNKSDLAANKVDRAELRRLAAAGYSHRRLLGAVGRRPRRAASAARRARSACWSDSPESASHRWCAPCCRTPRSQTGELMREEEGRHTTTASRAYALAARRHAHRLARSARLRAGHRPARRAGRWDFPKWRASRPAAGSRIAGTCRSRTAR